MCIRGDNPNKLTMEAWVRSKTSTLLPATWGAKKIIKFIRLQQMN